TDETPAPPVSSSIELEKPAPRAATALLSGSSRDETSAHDLTAAIKVESSVTRNRETNPQPIDPSASTAGRESAGQPRSIAREGHLEQRLEPLFKAVSQDREAGPKSEREIRVTIGRIDVRAVHQSQPVAAPVRSERPQPRLTLDSYLAQR